MGSFEVGEEVLGWITVGFSSFSSVSDCLSGMGFTFLIGVEES